LYSDVHIASFDAMRLGLGNGHDQGRDTQHYHEQAGK
jgi:hypothetical protein